MGLVSIVLVFSICWWLIFFMVLPFGIKTREEAGVSDEPEQPGLVASAPVKPRLWLKAAITTGIALVATAIIVAVVRSDFMTFTGSLDVP